MRNTYLWSATAQDFFNICYFEVGDTLARKRQLTDHNKATDLSRPVVKNNFGASKLILSTINNDLRSQGINFGVVIIPSKEHVIERWAAKNGVAMPEGFTVTNQKNLIGKYLAFMQENKISVVDATQFVVEDFTKSMEQKEEFYPFGESHPLEVGYASYSRAAERLISTLNQNEFRLIESIGGEETSQ